MRQGRDDEKWKQYDRNLKEKEVSHDHKSFIKYDPFKSQCN